MVVDGIVLHSVDCVELADDLVENMKYARTLPGVAAAHADVPYLAALNDIVQRLHRLLDGCLVVEAMALQQVDVVDLEAL